MTLRHVLNGLALRYASAFRSDFVNILLRQEYRTFHRQGPGWGKDVERHCRSQMYCYARELDIWKFVGDPSAERCRLFVKLLLCQCGTDERAYDVT